MNYVSESSSRDPVHASTLPRLTVRDFALIDFLRLLWRRRGLILGVVVVAVATTITFLYSAQPVYTARTDVLIDTKEARITDVEQVLSDSTPDKEALLSEIEVIRSRGLIEKVIDDYQLIRDPEFNEQLRPLAAPQLFFTSFTKFIDSILPTDFASLWSSTQPGDDLNRERNATVDAFLDNLDVGMKGQSRVISIRFSSEDPIKAAQLANAVAEAYLIAQLDAKYDATRRANQWLSTKLQDMRVKVHDSESAVEDYRRRAGLLQSSKDGTLIAQQVTDLNGQLMAARADRTAFEARLQQLRALALSPNGPEATVDVLGSPIFVDLLRQETEVKRKLAELSQELGDRHPRLVSARSEVADVQAKIKSEINKTLQKIENEVAIARTREASLQKSLNVLEQRLAQANVAQVQLRALEREAEANKSTLESFLNRFEELSAQSDLSAHDINARILSRAPVPEQPSAPQKQLVLGLVLFAASALAILVAFALESLDRGFRSSEQVEEVTGVRTLGLVPLLPKAITRERGPEAHLIENPSSLFAESIRSVYTSILISGNRPPPRSVLVTSSQPDEGKSTIAVSLARMCAISGMRTLVVEADLRKPTIHRMLNAPQTPGLVEFYRGEAQIRDILHQDTVTGCVLLPSGKLVVDPVKVLASAEIRHLLKTLAAQFDLIVIDTPPLMAVSDARVLAAEVDASIFVVRWGRTNRDVVRLGLKTLLDTGTHLSGVVLSRVNAKRHAEYGFGDSGYYYRGVKRYYTS